MSDSIVPANDAEQSGETDDPEILALLDFEPVPRKTSQPNAWTPEVQRKLIVLLAVRGSVSTACKELDKDRSGAIKLYNSPHGASFRAAWDGAVALFKQREAARIAQAPRPSGKPPSVDLRRRKAPSPQPLSRQMGEGLPGQILNEHGEWEDEDKRARRAEDARDGISVKLLRARRLYLRDISGCAGKRAAFEILTELPVDWEKAQAMQPQADEPWRKPRARDTDMLLTAEAGWLGEFTHGPDKKAELLAEVNAWRAERGMPEVCWRGEGGGEEEELDDHD